MKHIHSFDILIIRIKSLIYHIKAFDRDHIEQVVLILDSIMRQGTCSCIVSQVQVVLELFPADFQLEGGGPAVLWLPVEIDFSSEELHELLEGVVVGAEDEHLLALAWRAAVHLLLDQSLLQLEEVLDHDVNDPLPDPEFEILRVLYLSRVEHQRLPEFIVVI